MDIDRADNLSTGDQRILPQEIKKNCCDNTRRNIHLKCHLKTMMVASSCRKLLQLHDIV